MKESKEIDMPGLPKKDLLRVDEVARYFQVTNQTVRLWISRGHLQAERMVGVLRISRESIARCRSQNRVRM